MPTTKTKPRTRAATPRHGETGRRLPTRAMRLEQAVRGLDSDSPEAIAAKEREKAKIALAAGMRAFWDQMSLEANETSYRQLSRHFDKLQDKYGELLGAEIRQATANVQASLQRLKETTRELEREAKVLRDVTKAVTQVAKVVGYVDDIIGILPAL